MKKIGILTYHYSINEGAMLQARASQEIWKNLFPDCDVEIINIESRNAKKKDLLNCFKRPRNIQIILLRLNRFFTLTNFKRKYFNLSKRKYIGDDYAQTVEYVKNQNYDLIIVGSDEVWKIDVHKSFDRGFPNIYWLSPKINAVKISYAASAHKTNLNKLSREKILSINKLIKSFKFKATKNMLKQVLGIGDDKIYEVLDPTFLYDFSLKKISLEKIYKKNKIDPEQPIATIICEDQSLSRVFNKQLKKRGFQIISLSYYNKYADKNLLASVSPLEWAALISRSQFCLTEKFHGTIFSIKAGIPFLSIDRAKRYKILDSKIKQLLREFNLLNHLCDFSNRDYTTDELSKKIDFALKNRYVEKIKPLLKTKKEESLNFAKKAKELI